ncbi:MAG: amidinotransferase [Gammaproteobacteria bacterium]|nr:MAG: amidinotransferase [Gammaproteobacteria bacterium]
MSESVKIVLKRQAVRPAQTTQYVLMIEPVAFGFNAETAESNYFQHQTTGAQQRALAEFQRLKNLLENHGVNVISYKDKLLPRTPDAIFPSHAVSFHDSAKAYVYPMFARNRRGEIDHRMLHDVKKKGFVLKEIYDMCAVADSQQYLEGTGSMVLDRVNAIAYACRSNRTNVTWFKKTCKRLGYQPVLFTAKQTMTWKRLPIYHTDMMMTVGETFVVICLDAIDSEKEKNYLLELFTRTGKEFIAISEKQMQQFAGNLLPVRTGRDAADTALVMSSNAYNSLSAEQIERLSSHSPILHCDIATIEANGGASVGAMCAEIFLPRRQRTFTASIVKSE